MYPSNHKISLAETAIPDTDAPGIPDTLTVLTKTCEELSEAIAKLDSKLEAVRRPYPAVVSRDDKATKPRSPLYNLLHERIDLLQVCVNHLNDINNSLDL